MSTPGSSLEEGLFSLFSLLLPSHSLQLLLQTIICWKKTTRASCASPAPAVADREIL